MAKGQVCWEPGQTGRADRSEMGGPVGPTGRADRSDGPVGSCPVPCISPTGASKPITVRALLLGQLKTNGPVGPTGRGFTESTVQRDNSVESVDCTSRAFTVADRA